MANNSKPKAAQPVTPKAVQTVKPKAPVVDEALDIVPVVIPSIVPVVTPAPTTRTVLIPEDGLNDYFDYCCNGNNIRIKRGVPVELSPDMYENVTRKLSMQSASHKLMIELRDNPKQINF
jgi:hypothetical protein